MVQVPAAMEDRTMRKFMTLAAIAAASLITTPALAGNKDGHWQIKVLGTGVLPDGKISKINNNAIGLPAGSQTVANDNVVPTLAVEYFFTPNISAETICCLTTHHVSGAGAIAGTAIVDHAMILPATLTLKYHLPLAGGIKPYIGAGPSVFFYIDEKQGATLQTLNPAESLTWTTRSALPFRAVSISRLATMAWGSALMPRSTGSTPPCMCAMPAARKFSRPSTRLRPGS